MFVKDISLYNKAMYPELVVKIGEYVSGLLRHVTSTFFTNDEINKWRKQC